MQGDELVLGPRSRPQESRLPRQNFPLNLPTNRRLCSTVGGRIVEGWAAHCCAVSAALSRRHYDQLGALKPGLGLARPLWRSKELRTRQSLHDLPPMVG